MPYEIERKFLLRNEAWRAAADGGTRLRQGYLSDAPARTVRVRIRGERGYLTIKGQNVGTKRPEFEYAIPLADAEALLDLCLAPLVEKTRYEVRHGAHLWEIDVFEGANAGLVVAEVELTDEAEAVALPEWIGTAVSDDARYYNSNLIARPFTSW